MTWAAWLSWRWRLARMRHREAHLRWALQLAPDPEMGTRYLMVRYARRLLEAEHR